MDLLTYNVEVSNKDFSKVATLFDHVKIIRNSKNERIIIETDSHKRSILIRNGIPFVIPFEKE